MGEKVRRQILWLRIFREYSLVPSGIKMIWQANPIQRQSQSPVVVTTTQTEEGVQIGAIPKPGEPKKTYFFSLSRPSGFPWEVMSQTNPLFTQNMNSNQVRSIRTPHLRKASHNSSSLNIQPSLAERSLAFETNLQSPAETKNI